MRNFIDEDFLLQTETAKKLYHEHAAKMPVFDYHCHINPKDIAEDRMFNTITEIWLAGDHYKWRAMRTNGIDEKYCTGKANDWEKFEKWAAIEVSNFDNVPDEMETYTLESGLYAVFNYKGLNTDNRIFIYIFGTWLPNSDYLIDGRPHFEVLGDKYRNGDSSSEEEIWIPIKPK